MNDVVNNVELQNEIALLRTNEIAKLKNEVIRLECMIIDLKCENEKLKNNDIFILKSTLRELCRSLGFEVYIPY